MSLILDALKKSEAERQRGQVPGVLSPVAATASHVFAHKQSKLPWLILFFSILAMLIAAYFYTKSQASNSPSLIVDPVNKAAPQKTIPEQVKTAMPTIEARKPKVIEKPTIRQTEEAPPLPAAPAISAPAIQVIPVAIETDSMPRIASLSEMPSEQRQQLPALKLSMHVYSSEAGKRFAIIDGQRINEGSMLGSAVVEQIRQDGVVLSVQGQSYLLPRP